MFSSFLAKNTIFKRFAAYLAICSIVIVAIFGIRMPSVEKMNELMSMKNMPGMDMCPFMVSHTGFPDMNPRDHFDAWKNILVSTLDVTAIILFVFAVALFYVNNFTANNLFFLQKIKSYHVLFSASRYRRKILRWIALRERQGDCPAIFSGAC